MTDITNMPFINDAKIVVKWPKKNTEKLIVLQYLYTKFELGKKYSEKEVNYILNQWHLFKRNGRTYDDATMLRRALIDQGFMDRKHDGSEYWIVDNTDHISSYAVIS